MLAVTDSPASPLARHATLALYAPGTHPVLGESASSALGVIEALAASVRHRCEGKASQAIRQAQEALDSLRSMGRHTDNGALAWRALQKATDVRHHGMSRQ